MYKSLSRHMHYSGGAGAGWAGGRASGSTGKRSSCKGKVLGLGGQLGSKGRLLG